MKKILLVVVLAIVLAGCQARESDTRERVKSTKSSIVFVVECLNGVGYYRAEGYGYLAVQYNRDGTVATC